MNAIKFLQINKTTYNDDDFTGMQAIIEELNNLPDLGKIETVTVSGMFGRKEKQYYICPNGHKNSPDFEFCQTCNLNIKGLKAYELAIIDDFEQKTAALGQLLHKQ